MVHRMNDDWRMEREAFKKEQDRAAAYADRRRADYQFKEGQDVVIKPGMTFFRRAELSNTAKISSGGSINLTSPLAFKG